MEINPSKLIHELCQLQTEVEWVEFKHNNEKPIEIGEYISAISNAAAISKKENGYLVWGIEDSTHKIIGTKFKPRLQKKEMNH